MRTYRRWALGAVCLAGMLLLLPKEVAADMKFASEEIAAAAEDPAVAGALAARRQLDAGFAAQDVDAVAALCAEDLIVNTPANRVARRETVLALFKAGRMKYEGAEEVIEAFDVRPDQVVIMGAETVKPGDTAANTGKTVHRRFTDVWRRDADGQWRLTIRQATITAVE